MDSESLFHCPIDVVRAKSYVNGLFNPTKAPVRVSVVNLTPYQKETMTSLVGLRRLTF